MVKNIRGETPLDLAAQFGRVDTVSMHPLYCSMYPLLYI